MMLELVWCQGGYKVWDLENPDAMPEVGGGRILEKVDGALNALVAAAAWGPACPRAYGPGQLLVQTPDGVRVSDKTLLALAEGEAQAEGRVLP